MITSVLEILSLVCSGISVVAFSETTAVGGHPLVRLIQAVGVSM